MRFIMGANLFVLYCEIMKIDYNHPRESMISIFLIGLILAILFVVSEANREDDEND